MNVGLLRRMSLLHNLGNIYILDTLPQNHFMSNLGIIVYSPHINTILCSMHMDFAVITLCACAAYLSVSLSVSLFLLVTVIRGILDVAFITDIRSQKWSLYDIVLH